MRTIAPVQQIVERHFAARCSSQLSAQLTVAADSLVVAPTPI